MSLEAQLRQADLDLASVHKQLKKLQEDLKLKTKIRNDLFEKVNKKNYSDIKWLIKNPHAPNGSKALSDWMDQHFGGDYEGVRLSGYRYTDHDNLSTHELGVELRLRTYCIDISTEEHEGKKDHWKKNFDLMVTELLPVMEAYLKEDGRNYYVIDYNTDEYSGIFSIAYCKEDGLWYQTNQRYGTFSIYQKAMTSEEAFELAFNDSQEKEEEED